MPGDSTSRGRNEQAWYGFTRGGSPAGDISPEIVASWERCRSAGLSPDLVEVAKVTEQVLAELLQKNAQFIETSRPLIHHLYKFLAGSGVIVSLCDADGILLYVVGDPDAVHASHENLVPGADWSELSVGTNSIGSTLLLDEPTQLWGFEHFCKLSQRWVGSGAPIHAPNGKLIGGLNISGRMDRSHLHTLGMAVITAQAIGMQLKLEAAISHSNQINQHQEAIISAMSEGIIILDEDFTVSLVNQYIAKWLNTSTNALTGCTIDTLCGDRNLLKIIRSRGETTDYITELEFEGAHCACTITCKVIAKDSGRSEMLLIGNDILRARKLARRLGANEAVLTFRDIVSEDLRLRSLISLAMAAAETSASVLILGESGTGKEVFAQAIHSGSPRADGPFIAINCAAIPKELVASTLFGYEEGAFTGAKRGGSPGKFELADRGTLFLDEIGDLPLDIQAVLLRVLETKSFTRVGGKDVVSVDVRIIAATNRDLLYETQIKHFRQDLFYRLNVFSISLPPLRERRGDIALLAGHFLTQMNQRYQRSVESISEDAMTVFMRYDWPGNIRELQNTVERAVVMSTGVEITRHVVTLALPMTAPIPPPSTASVSSPAPSREDPISRRLEAEVDECARIRSLLEECHWNISKTAVKLGVARSTLYRKIYYYSLTSDD